LAKKSSKPGKELNDLSLKSHPCLYVGRVLRNEQEFSVFKDAKKVEKNN